MSWRLVLGLALFGLVMALATVYAIPLGLESVIWTGVIVTSALLVGIRAPGRFFWHGFLVGLANWISVTATHVLLFDAYVARHAKDAAATAATGGQVAAGAPGSFLGPIVGAMQRYDIPIPGASAVLIGLLAWAASRFMRRASGKMRSRTALDA